MTTQKFSFRKRLQSFQYAFEGIYFFILTQHNAWIHLVCAFGVIFLGFWYQINTFEWILLIFAISFVLMAEAFNTAIEQLADMVLKEMHPQIKIIKDVAAGAVLIAAIGAALIGLLIFLPKILY